MVWLDVGVNPACFSSQVFTGSSVRFNRSTPEMNPLQKAAGSLVNSLIIGVSSLKSMRFIGAPVKDLRSRSILT